MITKMYEMTELLLSTAKPKNIARASADKIHLEVTVKCIIIFLYEIV